MTPRPLILPLAISAGVAALFLILAAAGADLLALVDDPIAAADVDRGWLGLLSQVVLLSWPLSAGLLLAAGLMSRQAGLGAGRAAMAFWGAALFLGLGLDDAVLLHERLLPDYAGISQPVSKAFWAVAAVAWVAAFRRELATGSLELLLAAGCLFGASIVIDTLVDGAYEAEEGFKFAGLLTLLAWSVAEFRRTAADSIPDATAR